MRHLLMGFMVAAIIAVIPALALADNQEVAEQIAQKLRDSGQLTDYKIGVKYQNGTAWIRGHVASQEQMHKALRLTFQTSGVGRVVNELTVAAPESDDSQVVNPLRGSNQRPQRLGLAGRLEAAISGGLEKAPRPLPIRETAPSRADRLQSSYALAPVKATAAEEPRELPRQAATSQRAVPVTNAAMRMAMMQQSGMQQMPMAPNGGPLPMYRAANSQAGVAPARYDQPQLPNYAWPSYAAYPNYAAVTYPKQYSPTAWPYIGPFYPYPQVPLGWRKVTLEWDDGWWFLDFKDQPSSCWHR